jgi:alkaline phosphatase
MRLATLVLPCALLTTCITAALAAEPEEIRGRLSHIKTDKQLKPARRESPQQWFRDGARAARESAVLQPIPGKAKNVILFVGDGMGVSTVSAARILQGQLKGESGEENSLSFERFPYVSLS